MAALAQGAEQKSVFLGFFCITIVIMSWVEYIYVYSIIFIHGCLIIMVDVSDYNPWVC